MGTGPSTAAILLGWQTSGRSLDGELTLRANQLAITDEPTFFTISREALEQAMSSGKVIMVSQEPLKE